VETSLATLTRMWRGDLAWREALRSGDIEISGTTGMRRAAPRWLGVSSFPPVSRAA